MVGEGKEQTFFKWTKEVAKDEWEEFCEAWSPGIPFFHDFWLAKLIYTLEKLEKKHE